MKILYFASLWEGSTALQRVEALRSIDAVNCIPLDVSSGQRELKPSLYSRVRYRLGWPLDSLNENALIFEAAKAERPDVLLVDNSKVLQRDILKKIKNYVGRLVYYSPDDMLAPHFMKRPLKSSLDVWDIVFTTKTFNVKELLDIGVRRPVLIGNAFDPQMHKPLSAASVGEDFEKFDIVFVGAYERERFHSLMSLARAGLKVLVHGESVRLAERKWQTAHPNFTLRGPAFGKEYARVMHHGKIAMCFLRKINRDQITTRSIEIPAMGRPMLAEKTEEHDAHFLDGSEYIGFLNDADMISKAQLLLSNVEERRKIGAAGLQRCNSSGYSTLERTKYMISNIQKI